MFVKVPSLHVFSILTFMLRFQSFTFAKFEDCLRILLAEFKWGPTVLRMKGNLLQQVWSFRSLQQFFYCFPFGPLKYYFPVVNKTVLCRLNYIWSVPEASFIWFSILVNMCFWYEMHETICLWKVLLEPCFLLYPVFRLFDPKWVSLGFGALFWDFYMIHWSL